MTRVITKFVPRCAPLTKRRFLVGAAALAASLRFGPRSWGSSEPEKWDLIVVGGGTAGLPAAIFAAHRGARVLIIEAAAELGGTLFMTGGAMSAAGTKLQAKKGILDTPQEHYDDVMRISRGTANPELVRLAVDNAAATFDWLMDKEFEVRPEDPNISTTHDPYRKARYSAGVDWGISILKVVEKEIRPEIERGRISVAARTEATRLILDPGGAVIGVETVDEDHHASRHFGRHILLSSGGYASNAKMFRELEGFEKHNDSSYPYSQGAGLTLGMAAGGYVRGGEDHLAMFGMILQDDHYPSPKLATFRPWPPERPPWEIYVNAQGQRFVREDVASNDVVEQALRAQPNERAWVVFDDAMFNEAPRLIPEWSQYQYRETFNERMFFHRADRLEELARLAGVDPAGLGRSVALYNEGQRKGIDPLGRRHLPAPIVMPPFYAVGTHGWVLTSFAGLAVDPKLRVVRRDGTPIPNLYAAGEVLGTAATMGRSYCAGMTVTPALTFGRLLGQTLPFDA